MLCPVLGAAVVLGLAVRSAVWRSPLVLRGVAPLPNTTLASHAQTAYFSAGVAKRMRQKIRDQNLGVRRLASAVGTRVRHYGLEMNGNSRSPRGPTHIHLSSAMTTPPHLNSVDDF